MSEPAVFFVVVAGNAFLRLRAAGNNASEVLLTLDEGDRVELRSLAPEKASPRPMFDLGIADAEEP